AEIVGMEQGCVLGRWTSPLWRLSHAKILVGRRQNEPISPGLVSARMVRAQYYQRYSRWTRRLVGRRRGRLPQEWAQPRHRGDRTDGGGSFSVVFTHERRRSQGNRGLFEIAARQSGGSETVALR